MKNRTKVEDLGSDMLPGKPVSAKLRASLEKEKQEARKRIIERGIVHFRADQEFMSALLDAAEKLKLAPGTLCSAGGLGVFEVATIRAPRQGSTSRTGGRRY